MVLFSCKTSQKSVDAVPSEASDIVISIRKTPCYGTCPAYEMQIYSDLSVKLKGERFLDLIGEFESTLSPERMAQLKQAFDEAARSPPRSPESGW